jgi:2-polyprenyl-6-methoxyphenol hydroxylase-like FAD-dependent oxidoreductase
MECILTFMRHHVRQIEVTPVLVVGAGPAGLTAAITLARAGVETLVVERRTQVSDLPRATGVSTGTMELLRSWGLEEQVRAAAVDVEWRALATTTLAEAAAGTAVEVGYPTRAQSAVVSPTRPACIPQDALEPILQEYLATLPSVRLERGVEYRDVASRADGVDRPARRWPHDPRALPRRRRRHPQHGARRARHPGLGSGTLAERVSVLLRARCGSVVGERRHVIYFLDGEVAARPVRRPDRWVFAFAAPGPTTSAPRSGARWAQRWRSTIEHVSTTTYAVELAERFRERSAFLIGDAAHRLTPRGATGMNTAIRDGYDLGWKLAWVLRGWAARRCSTATRPSGARSRSTTAPGDRPQRFHRAASPRSCARLGGRIAARVAARRDGRVVDARPARDGLTLFTGPARPGPPRDATPPVTDRRLDAITARALGILNGAALLVRPDGVPQPG